MTIETEITALTQATTDLLGAVNIRKATLDEKVLSAAAQVDLASAQAVNSASSATASAASAVASSNSAGQSAGSAAQALAIFGNTEAMQTAVAQAAAQASLAAGHAASASSVVQQDLSGVNAAALHRSPNAVTAMFVYDTSKDSDGGAWTEKCQHTSWYNEPLMGKWLGAHSSEANARNAGATLGTERITNGIFSTDLTGWTNIGTGTSSATDGVLNISGVNGYGVYQNFAVEAGKTYEFRVSFLSKTAPAHALIYNAAYSGGAGIVDSGNNTTTGDFVVSFTAAASGTYHIRVWLRGTGSAQVDNISVREVIAQTTQTGDYFQLTTDGKFYKLNATSGTTEVSRGNKADFPRLSAIVAESGSLTIYDLTEPGRPMWMRFVGSYNSMAGLGAGYPFSSISAINSLLAIAHTDGARAGLDIINFCSDKGVHHGAGYGVIAGTARYIGNIAQRNGGLGNALDYSLGNLPSTQVNAVAMTVLPDAPLDPATGLQVPTIAVATAGGVSVIKHNGTVVNSSDASAYTSVHVTKDVLVMQRSGNSIRFSQNPGNLVASFSQTEINLALAPDFARGNSTKIVGKSASVLARVPISGITSAFSLLRDNSSTRTKGVATQITNTYNTGHMTGDIRRAYLADTDVGSMSGPELVTNGTFDADTGWTKTGFTISNGVASRDLVVATGVLEQTGLGMVVNKTYVLEFEINGRTTGNLYPRAGSYSNLGTVISNGRFSYAFTYSGAADTVQFAVNTGFDGVIDNVSVIEGAADRSYKAKGASITGTLTKSAVASAAQLVAYSGFSVANYLQEPYSADLDFGTGGWSESAWVSIPTANAAAGTIASRAHSSGAYITLGIDATNKLTAAITDGATTRTVTSTASYNSGTWLKVRANYTTDGSLALLVNGVEVAATRGAPMLTLNNPDAVLTIGNSYALDAPFPGSIALLKLGATVPTAEQSVWMYEQEKQMFRENAQVCLPDSGAIVDLTYDDATDKWIAVSATNESEWSGLVRTGVKATPTGSFSKVTATSGVKLEARTTTSPGVDITLPAYGLREELVKRAESAARLARNLTTFDYVGGFTANTTSGSTSITNVAGLSYPVNSIGAQVTGTGIPTGAVITAVSGTTIYLSKAATATGTAVQISFTDFILPVGYEAKAVMSAGALKQEGATKDYTRLFDGFKETVRFGVAPGYTAWVQVQAVRSAA